ncbi:MAG: thiamine-phosphate kinase, partial [Firmicutes bacterium]|nr:thiamine-phosphate kinase [Bacillota bacterium]
MMKVRDVGERELISRIHRLQAIIPFGYLGIGDDSAYLPPSTEGWLVSQDMLVEGIHFRWDWTNPEQLGEKAVAVNISDIAAMGGIPKAILTSISLPGEMDIDVVEALYRGIAKGLDRYGVALVGGDTVGSAQGLSLDVTALGVPSVAQRPILRRGARPG